MEAESRPGDEELAELARSGDREAYAELWQRHASAGRTAAWQFRTIADPDDVVSEAYLQILRALQRGGGPREAFRPYLYRTIRNVALGWRTKTPSVPLDFAEELADPAPDPETATIRNTITVRAFRTLPERWQTILWYTEVEGMEPAEAAPFLGLTANSAAALAYRAREGLKKAWLQAHVSDQRVPAECRWTTERMGDYVRGALTARAKTRFEQHLETCARCQILLEEIDGLGGRLAAILLPLTLGGTAGAALLAHQLSGKPDPTSLASARPGARADAGRSPRGPIAAVTAVVLAAASVTGAFALDGAFQPAPPSTTVSEGETPPTPQPERPSPEPTTSPTPPAPGPTAPPPTPPRPPVVPPPPVLPPVVPPVIPPDTAAPAAPLIAGPVHGTLTSNATPVFTGTGEPGAVVQVRMGSVVIASGVVAANGSWTATPTAAVPDGLQSFAITLTDPAGNRSTASVVSFTIDTVALPPAVDALPPGPHIYLPAITGTAEPAASIELHDDAGVVGTAQAAPDGTWSIPLPDPGHDGEAYTAVQVDPAGNRSAASVSTGPLTFTRPSIDVPVEGEDLPSTGGATIVTVEISGIEGMRVQVYVDGVTTGNIHTLEAGPITRVTQPLPDGPHSVGVRYFDPDTGRAGSVLTRTFVI